MKILKMRATFGKLQSAELALGEGLNVIEAPNEGGKSTWSAFLRAMLYGINTKERDRQGYLAEKNRYQPWSGAAMEGSVELLWQGRSVTLRRGPKGSTPFGRFEAVYTGTAEGVPRPPGGNAGGDPPGGPPGPGQPLPAGRGHRRGRGGRGGDRRPGGARLPLHSGGVQPGLRQHSLLPHRIPGEES